MKHITLLPRKNKLGVVYADDAASLSAPSWHNLPEGYEGTGIFTKAEPFAEYIKEVCGDSLQGSTVTLCLGTDMAPGLMFSHPKLGAGDLKKMRNSEFETVFPNGKNTMYTDDFSLYGGAPAQDGKFREVIYAIQREYADAIYNACQAAGVPLVRIVPFSALFEESAKKLCVQKDGVLYTEGELKAAIYMGEYDAALAIFKGDNPIFIRTLDSVGADLVENVEDLLKKSGSEAKEIIIKLGIDEDKKVGDDIFWLRERILLYFRDIASSSARAINATLSKEEKLSYIMVFGEFADIDGVKKRMTKVMETKIELSTERFNKLDAKKSIADTPHAAVLSAPYYADYPITGVNLLNNIKQNQIKNKQLKTAGILCAVLAVVLMLVLPVLNIITGSAVKKAKQTLSQPQYEEASSLLAEYNKLKKKYDSQKSVVENLPFGSTDNYGIINALNDLTNAYGTVGSITLSGNKKCSVSVSFSSYAMATQWKHAVDNNDVFSFYGSPAISGGGGYSISCELSIDYEKLNPVTDEDATEKATGEETEEATEEVTEEATGETTTGANSDDLLSEYAGQ